MGKHFEDPKEKILRQVVVNENGCWIWQGAYRFWTYGQIWTGGKNESVHRIAYREWVGPIPDGWDVDHECHNEAARRGECAGGSACPHRGCCNPEHLRASTRRDNLMASPLTEAAKRSAS